MVILLVLLTACEPGGTPIPAIIPPTVTPTPEPTVPPPVRYGLVTEALETIPDVAVLQESAQVEMVPAESVDLAGYDVVAGYGRREGWTESPVTLTVVLLMNESLAPMDDVLATSIVRHAIDPVVLVRETGIPGVLPEDRDVVDGVTLRTELANAGFPDGFDLIMAHTPLPGVDTVAAMLTAAGLQIRVLPVTTESVERVLRTDRAHVLLTACPDPVACEVLRDQAGSLPMVTVMTLPVSYQAVDDLSVTFTTWGFPVGTR